MITIPALRHPLKGEIQVGADKSISHRSIIFSSLAHGKSVIRNFLRAEDTHSTCKCMSQLGVNIEDKGEEITVCGLGSAGFKEPVDVLYCGNSGTTMRLLMGILAGCPFFSVLSGDPSLNNRPMQRVINPLVLMGASINSRSGDKYPPVAIRGGNLKGIEYEMPIASAQVKSSLILAGLNSTSATRIVEKEKTRDHSEKMLSAMGAKIITEGSSIIITPVDSLAPQEFIIPGDISSAAFFIVAASVVPGSEIIIRNVGINPSRTGILEVLLDMGANITIENRVIVGGEEIADIIVASADLKATTVSGSIIPRLIDELPILAVAMAVAEGESRVIDAAELRLKETDRITAICTELGKLGADIVELEDGFIINGNRDCFTGNQVKSWGDHRIAMSLAVAALISTGETHISNHQVVDISFPLFWKLLFKLSGRITR